MIPKEQIWTGSLNERALEDAGAAPARVGLYDTTLRFDRAREVSELLVTDEEFRELVDGR